MSPTTRRIRSLTRLALALVTLIAAAACDADRFPIGNGLPAGETGADDPTPQPACAQAPATMPAQPVAISPFQVAERLSRFLWGTPADPTFLQKVDHLAPATSADVAALAREMLDDARADAALQAFYRKWLERAEQAPPGLDPALWEDMGRETDSLVTHLTRYGGSFRDLLTVPLSFLDARLGQHYGMAVPGTDLALVQLDPTQRGGVLTHGSWLGSHPDASRRGRWVYNALYGSPFPTPPAANVHRARGKPPTGLTTRRLQEWATVDQAACMTCHTFIDPPGFLYEHYDEIGRFRAVDAGSPVDAAATVQLPGFDGDLDGAASLAANAASSCVAQLSFAQRWLKTATGIDQPEAAASEEVAATFRAAGLSLRELIVAVVQSRLFLQP